MGDRHRATRPSPRSEKLELLRGEARPPIAAYAIAGHTGLLVVLSHEGRGGQASGAVRATETRYVGTNPDVLAYDPSLRRLYVSAESGNVAV